MTNATDQKIDLLQKEFPQFFDRKFGVTADKQEKSINEAGIFHKMVKTMK